MKKFKYFIFVLLAITATIAFAAATDKYISSQGNIVIKTAASKTVGIQSSLYTKQTGEVGIGTASPATKLHVSGSSYPQFEIDDMASRGWGFGVTSSKFFVRDITGTSDVMTFIPGGNVGINNASPSSKLHITTADSVYAARIDQGSSGDGLIVKSGDGATDDYSLYVSSYDTGKTYLVVRGTNVGIGQEDPGAKLEVTSASLVEGSEHGQITISTATNEQLNFGVHDSDYSWIQAIKVGTATRDLKLNPSGGNVVSGGNVIAKTTYGTIKQGTNATAGHNAGTYKTEISSGATTCDAQCATDASNAGFNSSSGRCLGAWYFDGTWQGCSGTGTLTGKTCLCMGTY